MLMSSPDIQSLISRSCLINHDPSKKTHINPDDLEHPSKLIKFLVGVRHQNEYFPLGGSWSESLDGAHPESDPQVLIRTAVRCVQGQTGIDLSKCIQWYVERTLFLFEISSLFSSFLLFVFSIIDDDLFLDTFPI